jgi:hypothetical protein
MAAAYQVATTNPEKPNPYLGEANPYLQDVIDLSSRDLVDNYNRTVTPAQNQAAIRSGSFGNTGLDEMNRADQQGLRTSLTDLSSKLRFNDYGQQQGMHQWQQQFNEGQRQFDLGYGRALQGDAYSQNMGYLQAGLGALGGLQGTNATDLANANAQQNTPLNYYQQFANSANAIGGGGGTQTATQGTSSNPVGAALGGAQLGSSLYNYGQNNGWWGSSGGSTSPGITGTSGASGMANYGSGSTGNWLM